jgi:acyl-CoA-binding protein
MSSSVSHPTAIQQASFHAATLRVKESKGIVIQQSDMLQLYGLFKQGNVVASLKSSHCPAISPSAIFSPREYAKWRAWQQQSSKTQLQAQEEYICLAKRLRLIK